MGGIRAGSSPSCGRWDDTACSDGTAGSYGTGGSSPSFSHPRRAPVPAASPDSIEMTAAASSRRTHLKLLPRSPPCAAGQLYSAPLHAYSMQLLATWCAPCHPLPRPPTPPPLLGRQWRGTIRRSTIRMVASFRSAAPTRRLPRQQPAWPDCRRLGRRARPDPPSISRAGPWAGAAKCWRSARRTFTRRCPREQSVLGGGWRRRWGEA